MRLKLNLCFILTIILAFPCIAQVKISNMDVRYDFTLFANYDFDLKSYDRAVPVNSIVTIFIDADGSGRLATFVKNKNVFQIVECYKYSDRYELRLKNTSGTEFKGVVFFNSLYVTSFWFVDTVNQTAMVFYNKS